MKSEWRSLGLKGKTPPLFQQKRCGRFKGQEIKNEAILGLVGGFNPLKTYARQIGSFPQVGMKIKNIDSTT